MGRDLTLDLNTKMDYEFKVKTAKIREKVEDLFEFDGCKVSYEAKAKPYCLIIACLLLASRTISQVSSLNLE